MPILFGTDGVRGIANKELTPELAFRLGKAGAYVLAKNCKDAKIVIGKDTRISGDMLENALAAGICSVGVDVIKVGVLPTPAISFMTRYLKATAGIVISASHNPVQDNGIKFFGSDSFKLSDQIEEEIESLLDNHKNLPAPIGSEVGKVSFLHKASDLYVNFAKNTIDLPLQNMKIVIDCANGAASKTSPQTLRELGAEVIEINSKPNGININKECGSTHPEPLKKAVKKHGADIGIAHDGDADRVILVDEKGELVDGDKILVICALNMKEEGTLKNNLVVVTVMSNMGLNIALKEKGIDILETKVGDRYVLEKMQERDAILGGEQSGHIIFLEHNTTGDGLISALQVLKVMAKTGKKLSELSALMQRMPQVLKNYKVEDKTLAMKNPDFIKAIDEAKKELADKGRVLVRPSGTESLIRIMAEGSDKKVLEDIVDRLGAIL